MEFLKKIKEYSDIFHKKSQPARTEELSDGTYRVEILVGVIPNLSNWRKRLERKEEDLRGYNLAFKNYRFGEFRVEDSDSNFPVVKIIYAVSGNPWWIRPLTDIIRKIDDGHYIGKAVYYFFGKRFCLCYFTLKQDID